MIDKITKMNSIIKLIPAILIVTIVTACGEARNNEGELAAKKEQLQKLKENQTKLNQQIRTLEEDVAKIDTAAVANQKLVEITPVATQKFTHYIELQGNVDAQNISVVTPRGPGGQVRAVYVKQGDAVKKGQLLLKLDDAITQQQVEQLKVQLQLAETLYERRKNLWEKQIGTEVELLQAKSNVDNLKKQLSLLNEQSAMSNVYAETSGIAETVNIKPGEFFTAASAAAMGIVIVNTSNLKVTTQVPEVYLHKVNEGSNVEIVFPDINKTINSKISVKGSAINPSTRSFYIEAKLPPSKDFRPNQIALVKIQDYAAENAITIPMNTLQNDEKGKFVMVAVNENGKLVARKRPLQIGELYGNNLEVKAGLKENDALITGGFQGLYDGQPLTTSQNI